MSRTGLYIYEQHFLLSNRIVRFLLCLDVKVNLNDAETRNFLIFIFVFVFFLYQLYQSFQITMDSQSKCSLMQNIFAALAISSSFGAVNLHISTARDIIFNIKYDLENLLDENELKITKKYTRITKKFIIIFISYIFLYGILLIAPTILSIFLYIYKSSDSVKITYIFPVKTNYTGFLRYGFLCCQIIALFIVLIITCVIYSTYLVAILHACTQFNILIYRIRQRFAEDKRIQMNQNNQINQEDSKWMINIIIRYTRIAKYVNLINKLSKQVYIIGMCLSMIMIFFDILFILDLPAILQKSTIKIIECFLTIIGSIFIIYINFHFGQKLIDHSNNVFEELCQVPIYLLSKKNQKLLLLVTMRSKKPSELSIGGLFSASHEIFAGLIQKAFSFAMAYYSLIKST